VVSLPIRVNQDTPFLFLPSSYLNELNYKLYSVVHCIFKWFQNNQLVLNLIKTLIVKFASSKFLTYPLHIAYNNQAHTITENIKFLSMHLDCHVTWKLQLDNLMENWVWFASCWENYYYLLTYLLTYLPMYLPTYLITPWSRVLLEKLTSFQVVKKFPSFYGTRRFITTFTSACPVPLLNTINTVHAAPSHLLEFCLNIIRVLSFL